MHRLYKLDTRFTTRLNNSVVKHGHRVSASGMRIAAQKPMIFSGSWTCSGLQLDTGQRYFYVLSGQIQVNIEGDVEQEDDGKEMIF